MFHRAFQRLSVLRRFVCVAMVVVTLPPVSIVVGQGDGAERKQQRLADRYEQILLRSPRRGTALDRVYGYYAEIGTLDQLIAKYEAETAAAPTDANKWTVLGLFEAKRGNDRQAIKAFEKAELAAPTNAIVGYYLGQSLLLVGKSSDATKAIERAIAKKPGRADMLAMYQTLGRIHQRAHRSREALEVWNRLEKQFPGDQRVAEQIASALAEEEQFAEALRRYQALAERTKDDLYRRVVYRMEAANMTLRLGKKQDALKQFEALLASLKPESWLHQQVRGRIEAVYRQADDLAGLANYYERWLKTHADDLGAMSRLANTLSSIGRAKEAQQWFDKAIALAPSRTDLRQALIDQLVYEKKYAAAIEQYVELDKSDPNNPDYVRQWGLLVLRDKSRDEADRKKEAARVWLRLSEARPEDAVTATQVADLLRRADAYVEAERLYRKAVELNPAEPQYREYLGEFYHDREEKEKALSAWEQIATPPRRSGQTLHRLAEVLSGFGYDDPAIQAAAEACALAKDDFTIHMTYVDLLTDAGKYQETLPLLRHMDTIAENLEQSEAILDRRIQSLQGAELLDDELKKLKKELADGTGRTAERWRLLGRFHEAKREMPEAITATQKAIELDGKSIPATRLMARLHETVGEIGLAAEDNRRLAVIDPQFKTNYLTEVANLESRLGRIDAALKAGRDLIAAAPNNPEHYQFFASLCFRMGKTDEGLATLRRAVRANPSDLEQLMNLGSALGEQFRNGEAIELYWQAFEKATDVDDQVRIVGKLTELHLNQNQFDTLLERLERMRRESDQDRAMTFCVAAAHLTAQDYGAARAELSVYLAANDRDTDLLRQIATIAEKEGDIDAAIQFRSRLIQIAPSEQGRRKLAQLYMQSDQGDEAEQILANLAMEDEERHRVIKSVDELLAYDRFAGAATITASLLRDRPDDWEAIYRDGVSLAKQDKTDEAKKRFERILEIATNDNDDSAAEKERKKKSTKKSTMSPSYYGFPTGPSARLVNRVQRVYEVRRAVGLENHRGSSSRPKIWMPKDAGQARLAAIGWLTKLSAGNEDETKALKARFAAEVATGETLNEPNRRKLHDALYYAAVNNDTKSQLEIAKMLSHDGTIGSQAYYLSQLPRRGQPNRRRGGEDNIEPLPDEELDHVIECYKNVVKSAKQSGYYLTYVLTELRRADRDEQAAELYTAAADKVSDVHSAMALLRVAIGRADFDESLKLMGAVERFASTNSSQLRSATNQVSSMLNQMVWKLREEEASEKILPLLDRYWQFARTIRDRTPTYLRRQGRPSRNRGSFGVQIYRSGNYQYQRLDFPQPSRHFDAGDIGLLRNVFVIYQEEEKIDALLSHFEDKLQVASDEVANTEVLHKSIAAVNWWNDEQDAAVESLERLVEQDPDDDELKFSLAGIYSQTGDLETALETLESIEAFDQSSVARRENMSLNLAVQLGDIDRARTAAEYLFGIRLTSQEQIQLARQMHTIGLHSLAEAVLRRAQRRTGGDRNQLVAIMTSYAQQGKLDIAVQVAQQVLRRPVPRSNSSSFRNRDQVREQALRLLSQSGKLQEMITRSEKQRERSPKSTRILKMLAEYYAAANQPEKSRALLLELAELSPNDGKSRYQLAETFRASGNVDAAMEQYLIAFRLDANLYNNQYYQIQRIFNEKKKLPDLAKAFIEADLSKVSQPYYIGNMLSQLLRDDENRELGMDLFAKLWQSAPQYRYSFISSLNNGGQKEVYKDPRILKYAKESFFGTTPNYANIHPNWQAMSMIHSWGGDKVNSTVGMLLEAATAQEKIEEVRQLVEERLEKEKEWKSGVALKALLDLRDKKVARAKPVLEKLLADRVTPPGSNACMIIGQEVRQHDALIDFAQRLYEHASKPENDNQQGLDFGFGPGKQLLNIYKKKKEHAKAIALLREVSKRPVGNQYDPQYSAYQLMQRQINVAKEFMELEQPLDAIRAYRRLTPAQMQTASQWGGSYYTDQYNEGFAAAKAALKSGMILDDLIATFSPGNEAVEKGAEGASSEEEMEKKKQENGGPAQAIEYLLAIEAKGKRAGVITSPIADAIAKTKPENKKLQTLRQVLAKQTGVTDLSVAVMRVLAEVRGGDVDSTNRAVAALSQLLADEPLTKIAKRRPSTKQRRVAEDRIIVWLAAVAVLERDDQVLTEDGLRLAESAVEAARRQIDTSYAAAMLQQLGSLAIERNDKPAAKSYWREMLEVLIGRELATSDNDVNGTSLLRNPEAAALAIARHAPLDNPDLADRTSLAQLRHQENSWPILREREHASLRSEPFFSKTFKRSNSRFLSGFGGMRSIVSLTTYWPSSICTVGRLLTAMPVTQVNGFIVPATSITPASTGKPNPMGSATKGVRPVSTNAFDAAVKLAKLTIRNEMPELSIQCVRETLRAGPPIRVSQHGNSAAQIVSIGSSLTFAASNGNAANADAQSVVKALDELHPLWEKHELSPRITYELYRDVVLPPDRPGEVFLYQRPLQLNANPRIASTLSSDLAKVAVKADAVEELKRLVAERGEKPLAKLPALVVEAQLASATDNADFAIDVLDRITNRIQTDSQLVTCQMACYAAVPLLNKKATSAQARALLTKVADNAKGTPTASHMTHALAMMLIRETKRDGQIDDAVARLKELESVASNNYVQTSNPRNYYKNILEIGVEYARLGKIAPALSMLGKAEDLPRNRIGSSARDSNVKLLTHIRDGLNAMPRKERYEMLREWIMPGPNRRTIRTGTSAISAQFAPHVVDARQPADYIPESPSIADANWLSLVDQLLADAKELGHHDDLQKAVEKLRQEKLQSADTLGLLVSLEDAEPFSHEKTQELIKDFKKQSASQKSFPVDAHLLNRQLQRTPQMLATANKVFVGLSDIARQSHYSADLTRLRLHRLDAMLANAGVTFDQIDANRLLRHWTAGRILSSSATQQSYFPARWVVQDKMLIYATGTKYNQMYLNYPITGPFEFSADIVDRSWSEGSLGFGGVLINLEDWNKRAVLADTGNHNKTYRSYVPSFRSGFNRWTVKSDGKTASFYVRKRLVHRESLTDNTSPWIMFCSEGGRQSYFANPKISGDFRIPREVRLIFGNRMDGWAAKAYRETIPTKITALAPNNVVDKEEDERANSEASDEPKDDKKDGEGDAMAFDPNAYDWSVNEGVLYGRRLDSRSVSRPSRLVYGRPLLDGETISYEYFYEDGAIDVSPAIGRIVFGFQPVGVRLHWMQHRSVADLSELSPDHWVAPNVENLASRWKLKENDWNTVVVQRDGPQVHITLNDDEVGTFPVTPERGFSFFHFKDKTESRVRNVVLSGNWPESLGNKMRANLFEHEPPSAAAQSVVSQLIDKQLHSQRVQAVLSQTASLPKSDRYELLADWVLPNDRDPAFHVVGLPQRWWSQPTDAKPTPKSVRDYFALPALELVDTAKSLGRLNDLAQRIAECAPRNPVDESAQTVLNALVAAAADELGDAKANLVQLNDQILNADPQRTYLDRWPELLGMLLAERHKPLRPVIKPYVNDLAKRMWKDDAFPTHWNEAYPDNAGRKAYLRLFRTIRAAYQSQPCIFGDRPREVLASRGHPWVVYSYPRATTAGFGVPPSVWTLRDETLISRAGHMHDNVMYRVPLKGDFEFRFETKGWGSHIVRIGYAGKIGRISTSGTKFYTGDYHGGHKSHKLEKKVKKQDDWFTLKLKVANGECSYYCNDQKLYEYTLPKEYDGWLFLNARPTSLTRVRKLEITGNPSVPDSLSIMPPEDIHNWIRYYEGRVTRNFTKWDLTDGELKAAKFKKSPESDFEHLLSYHRPLLEDCSIEYEFYYEPGNVLTHPAVGRLAMLLERDGVAEHWITDAQFEASNLAPGNRRIVAEDQRSQDTLPLKPGQWNKMRFECIGDKVTLHLNEIEVYQRLLPEAPFQTFGLFHFADQTEARVRNVVLSGDWAKTLE